MARHTFRPGFGGWGGFMAGLAASVLIDAVAPHIAKSAAPTAKSALKFFFSLTDGLAKSAARTREQAEDFVATTRAEYDAEKESAQIEPHPDADSSRSADGLHAHDADEA